MPHVRSFNKPAMAEMNMNPDQRLRPETNDAAALSDSAELDGTP